MHDRQKQWLQCVLVFTALLSFPLSLLAFRLTPMESTILLDPVGDRESKKDQTQIFIENTYTRKIRVRFDVRLRNTLENGSESRKPTTDLVVEPTEIVVSPGQRGEVTVKYTGALSPPLAQERAFRIIASEVLEKSEKAIDVRLQYVASVYVVPSGAQPNLELTKVSFKYDAEKEIHSVSVKIRNSGTAHQILSELDFFIEPKDVESKAEVQLVPRDQAQWQKENLLAQSEKTYVFYFSAKAEALNLKSDLRVFARSKLKTQPQKP